MWLGIAVWIGLLVFICVSLFGGPFIILSLALGLALVYFQFKKDGLL